MDFSIIDMKATKTPFGGGSRHTILSFLVEGIVWVRNFREIVGESRELLRRLSLPRDGSWFV